MQKLLSIFPGLAEFDFALLKTDQVDVALLRANRASLINVEDLKLNVFVMHTGKVQDQLPDASDTECPGAAPTPTARKGGAVTRAGSLTQSLSVKSGHLASSPKGIEPRATFIPMSTGLYFDFTDHTLFGGNWWEVCPSFFDIATNARLVPMRGSRATFQSIESESRDIEVTIERSCCEVNVSSVPMKFCFANDPARPSRPMRFQSEGRSWSLRYVAPGRMARIELNGNAFVTRYSRRSFFALWWLVNHHATRGDEGYLLLQKAP